MRLIHSDIQSPPQSGGRRTCATGLLAMLALVLGIWGAPAQRAEASLFMRLSATMDPFAALFRPESSQTNQFADFDTYRLPARQNVLDWFRPKPSGRLVIPLMEESASLGLLSGFEDYDRLKMQSLSHSEPIVQGDTFGQALARAGVQGGDRQQIQDALAKVLDLRKMQAGWTIKLTFDPSKADGEIRYVERMEMHTNSIERTFIVKRTPNGFDGEENRLKLIKGHVRAVVKVEDGLYLDAKRLGVPERIVANLALIFRHQLAFDRDIKPGDSVEVLYEEMRDDNGELIRSGTLLYGKVMAKGKEFELYRFRRSSGAVAYYTPEGRNPGSREALSRKPIASGRRSSTFGRRKHPVTGAYKMHWGVDYAAPKGTPIYAAGTGTITKRGRNGAYGNMVEIKHADGFITRYAHMSAFKRGQSVGYNVSKGETIGFVGTTGRSTGNHLHYEIHKNGKRVNPLKVKLPVGQFLDSRDKARFGDQRRLVSRMLTTAAPPRTQVAEASQ